MQRCGIASNSDLHVEKRHRHGQVKQPDSHNPHRHLRSPQPRRLSMSSIALNTTLVIAVLAGTPLFAQIPQVEVSTSNGVVDVTINSRRQLPILLDYLQSKYGWVVDYEDAPYSVRESKDITDPTWRSQHPHAVGFLAPAGVLFRAQFPDPALAGASAPTQTISFLLDQYNKSVNSGMFTLHTDERGRMSVVGVSRFAAASEVPVLNRKIPGDAKMMNGLDSLDLTLKKCSVGGTSFVMATVPPNYLQQASIPPHPSEITCRDQIDRIIQHIGIALVLRMFYNIAGSTYYVNLVNAGVTLTGTPQ